MGTTKKTSLVEKTRDLAAITHFRAKNANKRNDVGVSKPFRFYVQIYEDILYTMAVNNGAQIAGITTILVQVLSRKNRVLGKKIRVEGKTKV